MNQPIRAFVACLIAFLPGAVLGQNVVYVDADATGTNEGTSWQNAFTDLQDGIAVATAAGQIWVAEGTYRPAGPGGARTASFVLRPGVEIYGGFLGNESSADQRPSPIAITTLSGDLLGNDGDEINLDDPTRADNSFHVVTCGRSDSETPSILDGFLVTGGNANGSPSELKNQGGAIQCIDRFLRLENLDMVRNSAGTGAGLYASGSRVTLHTVQFIDNLAGGAGGLFLFFATGVLDSVGFVGNRANQDGGGLTAVNASLLAKNLIVENNTAIRDGGGILLRGGITWIVSGRVIGNNAKSGGGIDCGDTWSRVVLANLLINGNSATGGGAGFGRGGGLYIAECSVLGVNLTVVHNHALTDGAAAVIARGEQLFVNSIFWQNEVDGDGRAFSGDGIGNPDPPSATVSFSILEGGFPDHLIDGGNNTDQKPSFVDALGSDGLGGTADDDLHLTRNSQGIDSGSDEALPQDSLDLDSDGDLGEPLPLDLDGSPRSVDGGSGSARIDVGAYEYGAVDDGIRDENPDPSAASRIRVDVYPTFIVDEGWAEITSADGGLIEIDCYDMLGRHLGQLHKGFIHPMQKKKVGIPRNLTAGAYLLVVRAENSSSATLFTKIH